MHKNPTLLVLAAGMATRYGSLKQLDGFGPNGETIIEYSVHDAVKAGFGKVVFVVREEILADFTAAMQGRLPDSVEVDYVAQELDMLPAGYKVPAGRTKPWGTGHAVWVASAKINEPFAVINADDFYGYASFKLAADFLKSSSDDSESGLVGFELANTLSEHGSVSRGICAFDEAQTLLSLTELTKIVRTDSGDILVQDEEVQHTHLDGKEVVSMNLMAFKPTVFPYFEKYLKEFLSRNQHELKAEFYLPTVVNEMIAAGETSVKVMQTPEKWFGVTYPEDKATAIQRIDDLIKGNSYPKNLQSLTGPEDIETTAHKAQDIQEIVSHFAIQGHTAGGTPYGSGHIHDTYYIKNLQADCPDYLLQRINHQVFKNVPLLMENIEQVTAHLRSKLENIPGAEPDKEVLTLVPTRHQASYYQDEAGNFWRLYLLLQGTRSYDLVESPQQAYEGGKAFGRFQALLADMDASLLHESIPDFHNVEHRLRQFTQAIKHNQKDRVKHVQPEIDFVMQRAQLMSTICRLGREGKLPLRITHNDTKFNNVLLDSQDKAQCVIDLDTVMPGYVAYDYGDAIRTTAATAAEDEKDLSKIDIDLNLFRGFTQGFLEETCASLTDEEIGSLSLGITLLPFIMGLRFLTDYIDGDHYYKIHFPEHNLQRAQAQFRLVEVLEDKLELLQGIIEEISAACHQATTKQTK
ncbi:phosphotransferase [Pontibacter virosus]|uniref:Phosphotransferase family enzyme n=1 Tax=Pontibacter virosus TaxID=1765052 RepID=A0A2U1B4W2_9BACT|nr:phosphotransferase [Pontibacter virosus]PVY43726.1 phosphotransferase family enzyme [Pontibacter virosus]